LAKDYYCLFGNGDERVREQPTNDNTVVYRFDKYIIINFSFFEQHYYTPLLRLAGKVNQDSYTLDPSRLVQDIVDPPFYYGDFIRDYHDKKDRIQGQRQLALALKTTPGAPQQLQIQLELLEYNKIKIENASIKTLNVSENYISTIHIQELPTLRILPLLEIPDLDQIQRDTYIRNRIIDGFIASFSPNAQEYFLGFNRDTPAVTRPANQARPQRRASGIISSNPLSRLSRGLNYLNPYYSRDNVADTAIGVHGGGNKKTKKYKKLIKRKTRNQNKSIKQKSRKQKTRKQKTRKQK
jgi:hypothetical protein